MTRVEAATQLAAIIAARLGEMRQAAKTRDTAARRSSADTRDGIGSREKETGPLSGDAIAQLIGRRVEALGAEVPDREHKVFRIFLEAVLANEFGAEVLGDPEFDALIDEVQRRMSEDAGLREAMRQAATLLLAASRPPETS